MKKFSFDTSSITGSLKISKAQQATLGIIGATAVVVGAGIVLIIDLIRYIDFNGKILNKQADAISSYTTAIKNSGTCKPPQGKEYTSQELEKCMPNNIDSKDVSGSLRATIMEDRASDTSLESIGRPAIEACINDDTDKPYTAQEIKDIILVCSADGKEGEDCIKYGHSQTDTPAERHRIKELFQSALKLCSALRVIPDSLPTIENKEALLSSLSNIYLESNMDPDLISPSDSGKGSSGIDGLSLIPVTVKMGQAQVNTVNKFFKNLGRSVRIFNIKNLSMVATKGTDRLDVSISMDAYYTDAIEYSETEEIVSAKGKK